MTESVKILKKKLDRMTAERDTLRTKLRWTESLVKNESRRIDTLEAQVASIQTSLPKGIGIVIKGWWCTCGSFNGEEHSARTECRSCDQAKP